MGKEVLVDLSHPFGDKCPLWPYFADVKIERMHYMAKSGVLSQTVTTVMHCTTHADSPAHVFEGGRFTHEIPLTSYYGDAAFAPIILLILMDSSGIPSNYLGSANGVFFCVAEIGGFLAPLVMGSLFDMTEGFLAGVLLLVVLNLIILPITFRLKIQTSSPSHVGSE